MCVYDKSSHQKSISKKTQRSYNIELDCKLNDDGIIGNLSNVIESDSILCQGWFKGQAPQTRALCTKKQKFWQGKKVSCKWKWYTFSLSLMFLKDPPNFPFFL
jgi:hypothetical protein